MIWATHNSSIASRRSHKAKAEQHTQSPTQHENWKVDNNHKATTKSTCATLALQTRKLERKWESENASICHDPWRPWVRDSWGRERVRTKAGLRESRRESETEGCSVSLWERRLLCFVFVWGWEPKREKVWEAGRWESKRGDENWEVILCLSTRVSTVFLYSLLVYDWKRGVASWVEAHKPWFIILKLAQSNNPKFQPTLF